ncbi:MAG: flagellar hook-associated protein 2 [Oligoflexia bacterium]|nr:MAG: flagellar hook-associated protein 2 [Oligoflexia bacterium]
MAAIRMTGMASGLPPNIVEQIMDAERIPIKQMEVKKAAEDDKYKLVTDLETKVTDISKSLGELVGTRGFTNNKLMSGDPNIINGTVDPENVTTGSWQIEVQQLAQKPGSVSNGFPDRDRTEIGVGYIKFETPEGTKEVYVSGENSTLDGVAASINRANVGLRATVLNDRKDKENPFKLLVTGLATGDDKQVSFPTVYMLDGDQDFYFDVTKPAQNAKIKVDGFELEVPDNTVKDVIPGVALELKQAAPGREIAVTVKEDYDVISGKIKTFVDAYNGVLSFIQNQHKLQKGKNGRESLGPMGGDGLLRTIEANLRRLIMSPQHGVNSEITRMNELGIEFNRNGTLNFSQDKFNSKLSKNPQDVANFLRGDGFSVGFVPAVKREVTNLTNNTFGPLALRKRGLTEKINSMNQRIEKKESQLEKKEDSLRKKFSDLESKMSKLNAQGASVAGLAAGQKA